MASVIREKRNGRTLYRVQFTNGDKRRQKIRLGGVSLKDAQAIASKVDALNSAKISGGSWQPDLASWVAGLGQDLADKLAEAGLIEPKASATLGEFLTQYVAGRKDGIAVNTFENYCGTKRLLLEHFGEDKALRSLTLRDADTWHAFLSRRFSDASVSQHVGRAKLMLRVAQRYRLIESNPFADLHRGSERNDERQHFITLAVAQQVLDACPDAELRLCVALARLGGLRTPSEPLALRWGDIDWGRERFTVTSAKTARKGKPWRVVPLFPSLRPYLEEAFALADEGSEYVITRYRQGNYHDRLLRILRKAGIEPWPRLWHNLRASCQTELENHFPSHVVCSWLGNTEAVARRHYLQVTEEHFARAVAPRSAKECPTPCPTYSPPISLSCSSVTPSSAAAYSSSE